jgi:hypothetical protein
MAAEAIARNREVSIRYAATRQPELDLLSPVTVRVTVDGAHGQIVVSHKDWQAMV